MALSSSIKLIIRCLPRHFPDRPKVAHLINLPYQSDEIGGHFHAGIKLDAKNGLCLKTLHTSDTPIIYIPDGWKRYPWHGTTKHYLQKGCNQASLDIARAYKNCSDSITRHCKSVKIATVLGYFPVKTHDPLAQFLRPGIQIVFKQAPGIKVDLKVKELPGSLAKSLSTLVNIKALNDREYTIKKTGFTIPDRHNGNIFIHPKTGQITHIDYV